MTEKMSEAEQALRAWRIKYKTMLDGTIVVPGDLNISKKELIKLPDLTNVIVEGDFYCSYNNLTSLQGAPKIVKGHYNCYNNSLETLKGAPERIGGGFSCFNNDLVSLEAVPKSFKSLLCDWGQFRSWDDIPEELRVSKKIEEQSAPAKANPGNKRGFNL